MLLAGSTRELHKIILCMLKKKKCNK